LHCHLWPVHLWWLEKLVRLREARPNIAFGGLSVEWHLPLAIVIHLLDLIFNNNGFVDQVLEVCIIRVEPLELNIITAESTCATPPCCEWCTTPRVPPLLPCPPCSPDDETKSPFASLQSLPPTVFERQATTPLHRTAADVRLCHTTKRAPSCATPHRPQACFRLQC
jgi:hypothetical protein